LIISMKLPSNERPRKRPYSLLFLKINYIEKSPRLKLKDKVI